MTEHLRKKGRWLLSRLSEIIHSSTFEPEVIKKDEEDILLSFKGKIDRVGEYSTALFEEMAEEFQNLVIFFSERYMDTRLLSWGFKIFNKHYLIYRMRMDIVGCIMSVASISELSKELHKYARVYMDLNGLKIYNTFATKDGGDKVIQRVCSCLLGSQRIEQFCGINQLDTLLTSEGGDEWGYWLYSRNGHILRDTLDDFCALIRSEITRIDISDIMDFSKPGIVGVCHEQGVTCFSKDSKLELSMACGYCNAYDAIMVVVTEPEYEKFGTIDSITKEQGAKFLNRILHYLFAVAESIADSQKIKDQKDDILSEDPNKKLRGVLKERTSEGKMLLEENIALKAKIEKLEALIKSQKIN